MSATASKEFIVSPAGAPRAGRGEGVRHQEDTNGEARADQQGAWIEPASEGHGDSMAAALLPNTIRRFQREVKARHK